MITHNLRWRGGSLGSPDERPSGRNPASGPRHTCQIAEALVTVIEGACSGAEGVAHSGGRAPGRSTGSASRHLTGTVVPCGSRS